MSKKRTRRVRALNTTHVHPAQQTGDGSTPAPRHGEYKLSFLDLFQLSRPPIQRLFLFDGPDLPPFPSIVRTLRSSLAETLAVFLPLAGKLAFRADSGDVVIDCSPDTVAAASSGVEFVEAEFSGSADEMRRLARDPEHDTEAFEQLVPDLEVAHRLPAPVLAVQVTRPTGGSDAVAVGVSMLHAVADGHAVWQFVRAWSTVAREGSLVSAAAGLPTPTFDRAGVRHPKRDELTRTVLRMFAPAIPVLRQPSSSSAQDTTQTPRSRRTFVLRADEIQSLKQRISEQTKALGNGGEGEPCKPPSTYVAISSLLWTSLVRCKPMPPHDSDDSYFMVNADCRRRLRPPLGDGFFGNCIKPCYARARTGDVRDGGLGLARAASAIQDAIREYLDELDGDPLSDVERCLEVRGAIPRGGLAVVGGSHRFKAYETDFGWGKPSRVELVAMFTGEMALLLGAREEGAVQVSVTLDRAAMDNFVSCFVVPASDSGGGE